MFFLELPFTVEESTWLWLAISHHLQRGYHSHHTPHCLTLPPVFTQIDCERKIIKIIYNPHNVVTHHHHHRTPPTARAESLVLLTQTVGQASALVRQVTQWPESNGITFTATFQRPSELYPLWSVILIWNMIFKWKIFYSLYMMYMKLYITRYRVVS